MIKQLLCFDFIQGWEETYKYDLGFFGLNLLIYTMIVSRMELCRRVYVGAYKLKKDNSGTTPLSLHGAS